MAIHLVSEIPTVIYEHKVRNTSSFLRSTLNPSVPPTVQDVLRCKSSEYENAFPQSCTLNKFSNQKFSQASMSSISDSFLPPHL